MRECLVIDNPTLLFYITSNGLFLSIISLVFYEEEFTISAELNDFYAASRHKYFSRFYRTDEKLLSMDGFGWRLMRSSNFS
jgi:hypothetical protein